MKKYYPLVSVAKKLELELYVPDNVFQPSFMTREVLRAFGQLGMVSKNSQILDLGTGSGIISLTLNKVGYKNIYASDKLKTTVNVAAKNFKQNNFNPKQIFVSDIFDEIPLKFDLIITNPPAYPTNAKLKLNDGMDISIYSGEDGRDFIRGFLKEVRNHLTEKGKFLMTVPSFLDWNYTNSLLRDNKLDYREITSERCTLPTYGYPPQKFIANFRKVFSPSFYHDGNVDQNHYWMNLASKKIEFKVKTICGWPLVKEK